MVLTMTAAFAEGAEEAEWGMAEFAAHADIRYELANDYTGKTVILHSNDVHGQVDGYAYIAGLRDYFKSLGAEVILADAGDFSQGSIYASSSKGAAAVEMMSAAGYDVVTLGFRKARRHDRVRVISKSPGPYLQKFPGCFVSFSDNTTEAGHDSRLPFSQKVRPQKEETPWLLTSPVSFSPALHIGQLWEEQLT